GTYRNSVASHLFRRPSVRRDRQVVPEWKSAGPGVRPIGVPGPSFLARFVEKVIINSPLLMRLDDWNPRAWPGEAPVPARALPGPGFSRRQRQRVRAWPKEHRARVRYCGAPPSPITFVPHEEFQLPGVPRFPVTQVLFEDHVGSL